MAARNIGSPAGKYPSVSKYSSKSTWSSSRTLRTTSDAGSAPVDRSIRPGAASLNENNLPSVLTAARPDLTRVPDPTNAAMWPAASRIPNASATVCRDTCSVAAHARWGGRTAPAGTKPASMRSSNASANASGSASPGWLHSPSIRLRLAGSTLTTTPEVLPFFTTSDTTYRPIRLKRHGVGRITELRS